MAVFLLLPFFVFAQDDISKDMMFGGGKTGGADVINEELGGLTDTDPRIIISRIINVLFGFLGIIAVSLVMYGGWKWMSSQGDAGKIEDAKKLLRNAVIGLFIILAAFAIVSFVLDALFGTSGPTKPSVSKPKTEIIGGIGALGNSIVKSVYPSPGQKEVPRNTTILVSFREPMSLDTICLNGACDGNDTVNISGVKIFESSNSDDCINNNNCADARVFTSDNKTFVFVPTEYLGSPNNNTEYHVYLTNELEKQDGSNAFRSFDNGYEWTFEVSTKIDLTPPQIIDAGVFPGADLYPDQTIESASTRAEGNIVVTDNNILQEEVLASVGSPTTIVGASSINVRGSYGCTGTGLVGIQVVDSVNARLSGPEGITSGSPRTVGIINNGIEIGCGLNIDISGDYEAGNMWQFNVTAMQSATSLRVGPIVYKFTNSSPNGDEILIGANADNTATNISNTLGPNSEVSASASANVVSVEATVGGSGGNLIKLLTNHPGALNVASMSGGIDKGDSNKAMSRSDKYMNTIIQINFDEAVLPITLLGASSDVANTIKVRARDTGDWYDVEGVFEVSNQYRTVEFVTTNECGVNGCGEKIYCLPGGSEIEISLKAFKLDTCSGVADCATKAPFSNCANTGSVNVCQDGNGNNFPIIDVNLLASGEGGVMDAALNSFDGDRSDNAEGPTAQSGKPFFNENDRMSVCQNISETASHYPGKFCNFINATNQCGQANKCYYSDFVTLIVTNNAREINLQTNRGDDFIWSFFTNTEMKIDPPIINTTTPVPGSTDFGLLTPVEILFNSVMMSSSLSTGSKAITNGVDYVVHRLINLWDNSNRPLGYWATKNDQDLDLDGESDVTTAYINHTEFTNSSEFGAQAGSGVKDIYQNCFKPSSSTACTGGPSCCDNVSTAANSCP